MGHGTTRTRVWAMYTPPLAGQKAANLSPRPIGSTESGRKSSKHLLQVMTTPQPHGMNRYRTNNGH